MLIFFSYQHDDRVVAAEIAQFYGSLGIDTFMAHENISVSTQWQATILEKLRAADMFVAVLTSRYLASVYCLQESGIAMHRLGDMTIVPLSVDGTLPPGFMSHIQAKIFKSGQDNNANLFGGLAQCDLAYTIDLLVNRLGMATSFRAAERWFALVRPYLEQASTQQKIDILEVAASNGQVAAAHGVRADLLSLLSTHGPQLDVAKRSYLEDALG